jgi:hypothetical protein
MSTACAIEEIPRRDDWNDSRFTRIIVHARLGVRQRSKLHRTFLLRSQFLQRGFLGYGFHGMHLLGQRGDPLLQPLDVLVGDDRYLQTALLQGVDLSLERWLTHQIGDNIPRQIECRLAAIIAEG